MPEKLRGEKCRLVLHCRRPSRENIAGGERVSRLRYNDLKEAILIWQDNCLMEFVSTVSFKSPYLQ